MRLPSTVRDGQVKVACHSRLGMIVRTGPVTSQPYEITPQGVWIDWEDAEEMVEWEEYVWCFRQQKNIKINPIMYVN